MRGAALLMRDGYKNKSVPFRPCIPTDLRSWLNKDVATDNSFSGSRTDCCKRSVVSSEHLHARTPRSEVPRAPRLRA